jgi:hypothetical protein
MADGSRAAGSRPAPDPSPPLHRLLQVFPGGRRVHAAARPEAAPSPPATGGEVEARGRRQPRSGDLLQPRSPPSSSPSFPGCLYLFLVGRGGRDGGEQRVRRRRLIFFLVGSKARESAAKLRRWRGRQLSWPDARPRREAAGGVVPLFSPDRLSPIFKRRCRSGNRWRRS